MNCNILSKANKHERDANIQFFEEGHKYIIATDPNTKYTSVTTWNHSHFPKFDADKVIEKVMNSKSWKPGHKYWGLTADQIKKQWSDNGASVSGAGTDLHYDIECFMNNDKLPPKYTHKDLLNASTNHKNTSPEWSYFLKFVEETPHLRPYRTEWCVYNEDLKLSGSIDMVYENPDGSLSIYDWKRSKEISPVNRFNSYAVTECISHIPDSNFWHYALQLNTYKALIEAKYDKKVRELFLVRLHPNAEDKTFDLIKLPILNSEIKELLDLLQSNQPLGIHFS
jgi:hypothetical protein